MFDLLDLVPSPSAQDDLQKNYIVYAAVTFVYDRFSKAMVEVRATSCLSKGPHVSDGILTFPNAMRLFSVNMLA